MNSNLDIIKQTNNFEVIFQNCVNSIETLLKNHHKEINEEFYKEIENLLFREPKYCYSLYYLSLIYDDIRMVDLIFNNKECIKLLLKPVKKNDYFNLNVYRFEIQSCNDDDKLIYYTIYHPLLTCIYYNGSFEIFEYLLNQSEIVCFRNYDMIYELELFLYNCEHFMDLCDKTNHYVQNKLKLLQLLVKYSSKYKFNFNLNYTKKEYDRYYILQSPKVSKELFDLLIPYIYKEHYIQCLQSLITRLDFDFIVYAMQPQFRNNFKLSFKKQIIKKDIYEKYKIVTDKDSMFNLLSNIMTNQECKDWFFTIFLKKCLTTYERNWFFTKVYVINTQLTFKDYFPNEFNNWNN